MPFKDPRARAAHNRQWRQTHRFQVATSQRAKALRREFGGTLSTVELRCALEQPCAYCGLPSEHVEHCTPLSRGGTNAVDNIVGACESCNLLKRTNTVLEFLGLWPLPF